MHSSRVARSVRDQIAVVGPNTEHCVVAGLGLLAIKAGDGVTVGGEAAVVLRGAELLLGAVRSAPVSGRR